VFCFKKPVSRNDAKRLEFFMLHLKSHYLKTMAWTGFKEVWSMHRQQKRKTLLRFQSQKKHFIDKSFEGKK
jgi:hypothetical protein